MAAKKYVLWGHRPEEEDWVEHILLSEATAEQCNRIEAIAKSEGWVRIRRMLLDDKPPDFAGTVAV